MNSKKVYLIFSTVLLLSTWTHMVFSQSAVPASNYGVWNRGGDPSFDPDDPRYDYLLGVTKGPTWAEIQPNNSSEFIWDEMQDAIDLAFENGQLVTLKINVGPQCPDWIYGDGPNDVPLVETTESRFDSFPYYLDDNYINYYYTLIDEFALFVYSQPQEKQDLLSFIFPQNGATGDEVPYKGELTPESLNNNYDISDQEWTDFRIDSWEHWKSVFRDGKERPIPFLFNDVFPGSDEWAWVRDSIGNDFGIKNSNAYARGHHLTNEENWYEAFHDSLVNPQNLALFNRAEMDQSWTDSIFSINTELGFYWGALGGLSTGLSIWDVTTSALDTARNNTSIQESFRFFTKYAGQIDPTVSTKAFIALHEGLNSADTIKFPQEIYGNAAQLNLDRYQAICDDSKYYNRGARMDHLFAAQKGQVWQRDNQTGYNDAGWEIWPTNYARFITQINPDETSIGLFRIGGDIDNTSSIYSRFARSFADSLDRNVMSFEVHENLYTQGADTVKFNIVYYDKYDGSTWEFKYDAGPGNFKTACMVTCTGSGTWKTKEIIVTDAVLLNNGPNGADFALVNNDSLTASNEIDDIFHMIELEHSDGNIKDEVSIISPRNNQRFAIGSPVTVVAEGFDFQGIEKLRFQVDEGPFFDDFSEEPYVHEFLGLSPGDHTLRVQMVDLDGNVTQSEEVIITLTEDFMNIISPQHGDVFQLGNDITVTADGFDKDTIEIMRFRVDGIQWNNISEEPYTFVFEDLPVGDRLIEVQMKDLGGARMTKNITITVRPKCPENLLLSNTQATSADYQASGNITSTQIILNQKRINYNAANSILLLPDFETKTGTVFETYIGGCIDD